MVKNLLIEMHAHSSEHSSCSSVSAQALVQQVFAKGLQGIILTDHHYLWSPEELAALRLWSGVPDHFLIMSGQEVRTPEIGDVLVYGALASLSSGTPLAEIHRSYPEAAMVWAHPYRNGAKPLMENLLSRFLDGVEIFSSNHTVRENSRGLQDWHRYRFTAIGGTDTHGESYAGLYPTLFDHPVESVAEIAEELSHGRCRPFFKEIPRSGANSQVTEVTIGTKGMDEYRERLIIRKISNRYKWKSAERAYQIMEGIACHGFDKGRFRIPLPIDDDSSGMTLIEQGIRGKSLYDKLMTSSAEDGRIYLQMSGQWLARLHNCRLQLTSPDEFIVKEVERLERYVQRFSAIDHPHMRKAFDIMEAVKAAEAHLLATDRKGFVQGHGDFHPKNIIIGQDSQEKRETLFVAAIDFESSFCAPPAFDVGCFMSQFNSQFYREQKILADCPEKIFFEAYLGESTTVTDEFYRQVEVFRARTNLSIAAYLIKLGLGQSEDLWRVLLEAERALAMA